MTLALKPYNIFRTLLFIATILLLANITVQIIYLNYYIDNGMWSTNKWVKVLIELFHFDREQNIPTFYSSIALLFTSILLGLIALNKKNNQLSYVPWLGLAIIFVYLSIDEIVALHEHLTHLTRKFLDLSGMGTSYWTIPYVLALIILFSVYSRFLFKLPKRTMKLFFISGFVFVIGAVGFELVGHRVQELHGSKNVVYQFLCTCEEFLEMLGVIIFIYALTSYKSFIVKIE